MFLKILRLFLWIIPFLSFAQESTRVGEWTSYMSFRTGTEVAAKGFTAYMVTATGMVSYNQVTQEYREFTRVNGLGASNPTSIYYDPSNDYFFIGYGNGKID